MVWYIIHYIYCRCRIPLTYNLGLSIQNLIRFVFAWRSIFAKLIFQTTDISSFPVKNIRVWSFRKLHFRVMQFKFQWITEGILPRMKLTHEINENTLIWQETDSGGRERKRERERGERLCIICIHTHNAHNNNNYNNCEYSSAWTSERGMLFNIMFHTSILLLLLYCTCGNGNR